MMTIPNLRDEKSRLEFRERLLACLGGEWPEPPPLDAVRVEEVEGDGYRIEKVRYQVEPGEFVSAYVLTPGDGSPEARRPAVAVWHQHAGQFELGKSEPAGRGGNPMHHTGVALAKAGYTVICPDAMCFEERRGPFKENSGYERFVFLKYAVEGKCLAWKNILDMRRAIDYLCTRSDVDPERVGCYGHSLGSTHTWLVGPWEPRLKCLVGNCCLPTYEGIHANHLLHSFSNFIPGLHASGDTADVAALIAPRALHLNFGAEDRGSPIEFVRRGLDRISSVYGAMDAGSKFTFFIEEEVGHVLSPAMWERVLETFRRHLIGRGGER